MYEEEPSTDPREADPSLSFPPNSSPKHIMFWLSEIMLTQAFFFEMFSILGQITGKTVPDFLQDLSGAAVGEGRTF